jgi:hypothetical protein
VGEEVLGAGSGIVVTEAVVEGSFATVEPLHAPAMTETAASQNTNLRAAATRPTVASPLGKQF